MARRATLQTRQEELLLLMEDEDLMNFSDDQRNKDRINVDCNAGARQIQVETLNWKWKPVLSRIEYYQPVLPILELLSKHTLPILLLLLPLLPLLLP